MTSRINPIAPRLWWDVLNPSELERIHEATLDVLETVGIRFPSERALDVLEKNGCEVDRATQVAKLPRAVVMEAVSQVPDSYVLAGRDPACDMLIDGKHCYLSNDGSGVFVWDHHKGEKRPSTKADAATSARFVDALPNISYYWGPVVTSQDVPPATKALHDAEAVFTNTSKHFQTVTTVGDKPARYLVEMAAAIAGGTDKLRERPILSFMQCAVDPLAHDGPNLEANLVAAEHGLASGFMPMPLAAGTGPATLAGNLVVQNAEALSGVVLLELAYPGRAGVLRRRPERHRPQDRRLHRRLARGLPPRRRLHPARPLLRRADGDGHHGHRRQGARLAGRHRRLAQHLRQRDDQRRHDERRRAAQRLQDPQLPAHGHGDARSTASCRRSPTASSWTTRRWRST